MSILKITTDEVHERSVERLANRPNAASRYGDGGLTPQEYKARFDALAKLSIAKINELIDIINSDAGADSIAALINTPIEDGAGGYKTLYGVLEDIVGGEFADYIKILGLTGTTLQKELEHIEKEIALSRTAIEAAEAAAVAASEAAKIAEEAAGVALQTAQSANAAIEGVLGAVAAIGQVVSGMHTKITDIDESKVDKIEGMGLSQANFTNAEKIKLAGLEDSHFKGTFATLTALQTALPMARNGDYAYVGSAGEEEVIYIWDGTDYIWIAGGGSTAETPASVKEKYESNPDTNTFTDAEKSKLAGMISAYASAQLGGYEGAEFEFYEDLAAMEGLAAELEGLL